MEPQNQSLILQHVQHWVEQVIIGLNLCPFAGKVFTQSQIRYLISEAESLEQLTQDIGLALDELLATPSEEVDTLLFIHPKMLNDFLEYWDFAQHLMDWMVQTGLEGNLQLATFHPDYIFEGPAADDPSHYTNRAPYPILHFLREESVDKALRSYPDPENIPQRNIDKLTELGHEGINELWKRIKM